MNELHPASPGGPELASDARWQMALRVAQSESFRRSPRLRAFLLFVVQQTLRGRQQDLNEYAIGLEVFERPRSYNPLQDSIVRSSARQLRVKLHEYFAHEGAGETWVMEIPKGSYVAEFVERTPVVSKPDEEASFRPRNRLAWVLSGVCVVLAVASWLGFTRPRQGLVPAPAVPRNLAFAAFSNPGSELNVVVADSALVTVNSLRARTITLEEYILREEQKEPWPLPAKSTPADFPGGRLITSFRDALFAAQISEMGASVGYRIRVQHSRLLKSRDFSNGNFIILGSTWSNPWVGLFEDKLNFRFRYTPEGNQFVIQNVAPQTGEKPIYTASPSEAHNGVSPARIALVRSLSGKGRVLLISGLRAESSEGAAEAVLAPEFLAEVERLRPERRLDELSSFELLVEVQSVDGAISGRKLLASRFSR